MWLSAPSLAGLPGLPSCAKRCREELQRNGTSYREKVGRGGGFEFLTTDLPPETQQALAARAAGAIRPITDAMRAGQQASQAAQAQACATSMARYGLQLERSGGFDPAQNPRLDLFQRFERYHAQRGAAVWPAIQEFCALWQAGQIEALPSTVAAYPALPAKTLDKWYRVWRVKGVEALLQRKPRADKGHSQLAQDEDLHQAFVSALVDMHDPTARQVRRVIAQQLGQERTPAEGTIKRWLREYKNVNKVALLKLKNPDGWRNTYMPAFGSRSEHITQVNEEWQLDSTIADAQQRVSDDAADKRRKRVEVAFNLHDSQTGEIRRHALIAVIDVFTRRAKVLVARTSNANGVKAVTRQAILAWGRPTRVKTDNGKDYTATDYDFALDNLKIGHLLCTPFSPDQKPFIERFFGTLLHDLFPMLQGFVGHDVTTRKAIESGKSFAQRFGDKGVDLHMTPEQLQGAINGWLDEYHARVHSELGCSPDAKALQHTTHVVQLDARGLDMFLMPVSNNGIRTVGKRGISMPSTSAGGSAWYRAPELARPDVMGQQVYCRIDDADIGAMHVFRLDGSYVCQALDHTRLGINHAELAAKTRAMETETVKPLVDAFRKLKRQGLTSRAVAALYTEQQQDAANAAPNVTRLQPRVVLETTPGIDSLLAATSTSVQDDARQAARAALQAQAEAAPVPLLDSPRQRYSAWVRLTARMAAQEQISARDADWLSSYQGSNEFEGWHALQQGTDPLAERAGG